MGIAIGDLCVGLYYPSLTLPGLRELVLGPGLGWLFKRDRAALQFAEKSQRQKSVPQG
jgi:hypothetical protein